MKFNMTDTVIQAEHVSKKYVISHYEKLTTFSDVLSNISSIPKRIISKNQNSEDFWALKDVSFEVKQGEAIGVIGRNGSGKSTLLKILSRITEPTQGIIKLKGRVTSLLEVGTGFNGELTGRENVFLNGSILGMTKKEINKRFDEIVDFAGVEKFIDTPVKRYSSGMYVRLAFAVAAHLESELLLVDEVLAVGDAQFQKKCLDVMNNLAKSGRTLLFVSHNANAVSQLCSKVIYLQDGSIVAQGKTQKIINDYLSYSTTKSTTLFTQTENKSKEVNLRKVYLDDSQNKDKNLFDYNQAITVNIEYEINKEMENVNVWIGLQASDGNMVFTTVDCDLKPNLLQNRSIGYYKTHLSLPGKFLNIGDYLIIVGIVKNDPLKVFDRVEALQITIKPESNSEHIVFKDGPRKGYVQPLLNWSTEKLYE